MKIILLLTLTATMAASALFASVSEPTASIPPPKKTMKAFRSESELKRYFRKLAETHRRKTRPTVDESGPVDKMQLNEIVTVTSAPQAITSSESVTNVQHAGVDEGGIVKVHRDHLVVLRRGRLFTVTIRDDALQPISSINAFGPEIDPQGTWYDEMLVSDNTIAVIGYSYERGGTEVGLFKIDNAGRLSYRATYHLRSDDYYSSRNYSSRLIGSKLIFYSPEYLNLGDSNLMESFPAVRKWHKGAEPEEFRRIVPANRVYLPATEFKVEEGIALHTVTVCELAGGGFDCEGTSVLGPPGHVFYVSPDSVYVWTSTWSLGEKEKSILFRMPLDGSGPSALRVSGSPVDQFSFLQSEDQHLNVLVRSESTGDGMWGAEVAEGDIALLRIPLFSFSDGSELVHASNYRRLPRPDDNYPFQNRFVKNYLIYGTGSGWGNPRLSPGWPLVIVDWRFGNPQKLTLPHGVDRIEQMGSDAVVVGTDGKDLHFSSVRLGPGSEIASRYTRPEASQGELRSHGFFYKPDGDNTGMLGLPISRPGRPGYKHLFENSAAILFLRNESLQFREIGELGSQPDKAVDDQCKASCVDWYGNARPLFLRGRVFALLGYELVEGKIEDGRIRELRRINYAPGS